MEQGGRKKFGLMAVVIVVVLLLITVVGMVIDARRSATLEILVVPTSAEVTVNGRRYRNGTHRLEPGEAEVVIFKEGFDKQEMTVELVAGETVKVYTYLIPEDGTMGWYLTHEEDQMILNTIGAAEAAEKGETYLAENPIIEVLPIIYAKYDAEWNYTEFRIDGGEFSECAREFCLKITDTTGGNHAAALNLIKSKGYDPGEYEVVYVYKPIVPLE